MTLRSATLAAAVGGIFAVGGLAAPASALPYSSRGGVCAGTHLSMATGTVSGAWGTATPTIDGVEYTVNDGWTVVLCAKGGPTNNTATIVGPASGEVLTPLVGRKGNRAALSHWSIVSTSPTGGG